MFCTRCGKEIDNQAMFCSACGNKVGGGSGSQQSAGSELRIVGGLQSGNGAPIGMGANPMAGIEYHKSSNKKSFSIIGVIDLIVGLLLSLYAWITYSNDTGKRWGGYDYKTPLTEHELWIIILIIFGAICVICGMVRLIMSSSK